METNKNNKRAWLGAMFSFALVAVMGLTFAFKPFERKATDKSHVAVWYFTGATEAQILDASNYSQLDPQNPGCGSGIELPCQVNFPEEIQSVEDLQDFLNVAGTDKDDIIALAETTRSL